MKRRKKLIRENKDLSIKNTLTLLFRNLTQKRKFSIYKLFLLQLLSGILEMATLASIIPFINAITNIDNLYKNEYLNNFLVFFNITNKSQLLIITLVIFIVFILIANLVKFCNLWLTNKVSSEIGSDLSSKIYSNILNTNYEDHLNQNSSEIIATISNYIIKAIDFIYALLQLFASIIVSFSIVITLFIYDWLVALSAGVSFLLIYGLIILSFRRVLLNNSKQIVRETNLQIKILQEGLGGIRDIILDDMQIFFAKIFCKSDYKLRFLTAQNSTISGFPKFGVEAFGFILISIIAYLFVINGKNSSYIFSSLGIIALGTQRLLPACQMIFYSWSSIQGSKESINQVLKMINKTIYPTILKNDESFKFKKEILLKNVSFKYKGSKDFILKNTNLKIKKGSTIGILGETGCGKSTLVDLIMGLLKPSEGKIIVDGVDINESKKKLSSWRKKIAHVPQNIFLSDATISENIAFGIPLENIDLEKVKTSAKEAHLYNFINNLSSGLNTFVGEMGTKVSGGQKQRIGIARAFYKNKDILILDEATSALDNNTENKIMESVKKVSNNMTVVIIAHRKSTLDNCDIIISIKNKRITKSIPIDR